MKTSPNVAIRCVVIYTHLPRRGYCIYDLRPRSLNHWGPQMNPAANECARARTRTRMNARRRRDLGSRLGSRRDVGRASRRWLTFSAARIPADESPRVMMCCSVHVPRRTTGWSCERTRAGERRTRVPMGQDRRRRLRRASITQRRPSKYRRVPKGVEAKRFGHSYRAAGG